MQKKRIIADKLFPFAKELEQKKKCAHQETSIALYNSEKTMDFIHSRPFQLTDDQMAAIQELLQDVSCGKRSDTLIQGDVGCGKTIIAESLCVTAAENGYQAALMCPTAVLAEQHFHDFESQLEPYGINVCLVKSKMKAAEKRTIKKQIEEGSVQVIIGTHSLISDDIKFQKSRLDYCRRRTPVWSRTA